MERPRKPRERWMRRYPTTSEERASPRSEAPVGGCPDSASLVSHRRRNRPIRKPWTTRSPLGIMMPDHDIDVVESARHSRDIVGLAAGIEFGSRSQAL